ncbi:hypothetical protein D3C71_1787880 [compost metagenome]
MFLRKMWSTITIDFSLIEILCKRIGIHHLRHQCGFIHTETIVIINASLSRFSRFGRDENHAKCGS